jgi:ATP-dependent helicase/nuclease subunit B
LHLVRDKGLSYRDIRLVCNDQELRGPILKRVFQEYGIPLFSDAKKDILTSPAVQYVLALLDVLTEQYRTEDLFRILKSGFGCLSREEVSDLENYAVKYRIRRTMWKHPFTKGISEYGQEGLQRLEEIRQRAVAPILQLEPLMKPGGEMQGQTVSQFIQNFYKYLYETVQLPERILDFSAKQEELGRVDLADETSQIWTRMIGILDQMMEIMGDETFDAELFLDIFRVGLSQVEIGVLPPTRDGLLMGTMQRTRMSQAKALIVVGANEGVLPKEKPEAGLFSTDEKEFFKEKLISLTKNQIHINFID